MPNWETAQVKPLRGIRIAPNPNDPSTAILLLDNGDGLVPFLVDRKIMMQCSQLLATEAEKIQPVQ